MIFWFFLVPALVPGLVSLLVSLLVFSFFAQQRSLFHHYFLFLAGSGSRFGAGLASCLASCLFFLCSKKESVPSLFPKQLLSGFSILARNGLCSIMICCSSWFRLGFRCLSPFFSLLSFLRKGVLFHHDVLVPFGSGSGSGACFPSSLFFLFSGMVFCSTMISWFLVVPALVPVLVSLPSLFFLFSGKGFCSIMMSWLFVVPALVPVLVSLLLSSFLSQEMEFVPSWSWFLLVPARVPVLVSLLLSSFFSQEWGSVPS